MKTYNDIYLETRNALRASGIEGYTLEARLLVATAAGKSVRSCCATSICTPPPPSTRRFRS